MSGKAEEALDDYGNPIDGDRLIYCVFPGCGCDGARLCMAENGANTDSAAGNVEGMWLRKDREAIQARKDLAIRVAFEDGRLGGTPKGESA